MREIHKKAHFFFFLLFSFILFCFLPVQAEDQNTMGQLFYDPNSPETVKRMPQNIKAPLHSLVTLSTDKPLREGYMFKGWADTPISQILLKEIPLENIQTTVYAIWEALPPQISQLTYDPNTNDTVNGMPQPAAARSGSEILLSKSAPERKDFDFLGWSADPDGSQLISKVVLSGTTSTVYAVWQELSSSAEEGTFFDEFFSSDGKTPDNGMILPATGFSSRIPFDAEKARLRTSFPMGLELMIPILNTQAEIVLSTRQGNTWDVSELGHNAGLLEGASLPGEGFSLLAAHNNLNSEETGPFVFLYALSENDMIFIRESDGSLRRYAVYANELIKPEAITFLSAKAAEYSDSLVLITCENETADGTYMYRRVIFAKPL